MVFNINVPRVPKFERVLARDVTPFIALGAPYTFARYVAETEPDSIAFLCSDTGDWALGGGLCSRLEVPEVWARVATSSRLLELADTVASECPQCGIALVESIAVPDAMGCDLDLHFIASSLPCGLTSSAYEVDRLSLQDFQMGRMHPDIQAVLGSLQGLLRDFGDLSKFFVCRVDGVVVAVADVIVRSGGFTAIQQVFTAEKYRQRGIASALVTQLTRQIVQSGDIALYVCAADNTASANTAKRAGYSLVATLANMKVGQEGVEHDQL